MMALMQHLASLNDAQRKAAETLSGPLLIVAGAGAGKTKTLTARIVNLIHHGVAPHNILAITFTNKAAAEMRERVKDALAHERHDTLPHVSTFHSLGVHILRENCQLVGRNRHFGILDESDAVAMIKDCIVSLGYDPKTHDAKKYKHIISKEKGDFVTVAAYKQKANSYVEEVVAKVWDCYDRKLKEEKSFDFDDLLLETVLLLKKHPEVRRHYQERFKFVHIDEYQDTNEVQYELTKLLVAPDEQGNYNICVVGDTDQNIYSWRGARLKNMLHFEKDFPGTKVFFLEQNYRSTKTILAAANAIIKKNTVRVDKTLFTENTDGEMISLYEAYDQTDEAEFVAQKVDSLIESGVPAGSIAILYRANFQSRVLEEAMLGRNVPYQVLGTKFYDRKEIKDMLAYIRAAQNPDNLSDIKRIINFPARGIGKVTLAKLFAGEHAALPKAAQEKINAFYATLREIKILTETLKPSELIRETIRVSGIEAELKQGDATGLERLENIQEMVSLATRYDAMPQGEGIEKMLDDAALASDQDGMSDGERIRMMTVHASKGLEFQYVFITGLEQDLFPHAPKEHASTEHREEERRLFYVALTRAEKKLFLTYATIRTLFGMRQVATPSEFLYDIPEALVEHEVRTNSRMRTIYLD
jgi:DNA helicase-2/ATP-dependent DNA helicase PcrA